MVNIARALLGPERLNDIGDADALWCEGRRLSYRTLADMADRAGAALRAQGLEPGERVVLCLADTELLVAAFLGAMGAGLVPVILARHLDGDDLRHVLDDSRARLLVTDDDGPDVPADDLAAADLQRLVDRCRDEAPAAAHDGGREAFWLFSSGTTGRMKGVIHGHNDLAPVVAYHRDMLAMGPGTRIFCTSRLSFAYALGNGLLAPLAVGATVVLQPQWPTPENGLATVRRARPAVVFSVPSLYRSWLALGAGALAPMIEVDRFVSAGEALPPAIAERWRTVTGKPIFNCYGCSETVFFAFASPAKQRKPGTVGFPCARVEASLRDEHGRTMTPGEAGRLFIRHPFLALGYGPAAAHAQKRFRDGWFATGDVFSRDDDGYWTHQGREDDWLKIAGRWTSLKDLEETAGAFPGVQLAVAVAARDADGFTRVALFLQFQNGSEPSGIDGRIHAFLDARLPHYKLPKWIRIVDDLPRTATGKVKKAELKRIIEDEVA